MLTSFEFFSGVLNIEAAIQITMFLACSTGILIIRPDELQRNQDPKLISGGSWKHRCCDHTSWMTVIQYDSSMSPRVLKPVLPDGRQISSGANGELKVNSTHRGLGDHAQYLFQLDLKNSSYNSHIFKVNFTIECKSFTRHLLKQAFSKLLASSDSIPHQRFRSSSYPTLLGVSRDSVGWRWELSEGSISFDVALIDFFHKRRT